MLVLALAEGHGADVIEVASRRRQGGLGGDVLVGERILRVFDVSQQHLASGLHIRNTVKSMRLEVNNNRNRILSQ